MIMTKEKFIKHVSDLRKKNKNKWVICQELIDGRFIEYKAYNTWIQILRIDGVKYSNPMNQKVKEFLLFLELTL